MLDGDFRVWQEECCRLWVKNRFQRRAIWFNLPPMTQDVRFIHLRVHTEYSLLEGAMRLKKLPSLCADAGMPAVAVTDTNNLFSALEFSVTAAGAGIQPIIGCQVDVAYVQAGLGEKQIDPAPMVFLAQNETGYENLMKLNTCLYVDKGGQLPQVTLDEVDRLSAGVICLTGGSDGPVGRLLRNAQRPAAQALIDRLHGIFGDRLYMELQRHPGDNGLPEAEALSERGFVEMAYAMDIPLVATNDVYFPKPDMYEAHDALICIADGAYVDQQSDRRRLTSQHYFKSPQEMATLFADLPEALENTVEIAQRCAFMAYRRDPILPKFADDEVQELRRQAVEGLKARLAVIPHAASVEEYEKRLEFELNIIEGMGFPGYFLIVADFIKWAKDHDIPVGPGRGSGAGSLVAYALKITDLDPIRFGLLFERFLNPERVSMPDFDIDFCQDRREDVINYVRNRYGHDKVAQIITFGSLQAKAAIRDVGRVLEMPYGQVDRIAKLIPNNPAKPTTIKEAIDSEEELQREISENQEVEALIKTAIDLEGLNRHASTHAAGLVIGDRPLNQLVPLYKFNEEEMPATQFNMKFVEKAGLVKFDFLGLKTLTVLSKAESLIKHRVKNFDLSKILLDDKKTYEMLSTGSTTGIFQLESSGMKDVLTGLKPDRFEDIIAVVSLYRPGPMENIPSYINRKHGKEKITYMHSSLKDVLEETFGIFIYQEQVLRAAQILADFSLGRS